MMQKGGRKVERCETCRNYEGEFHLIQNRYNHVLVPVDEYFNYRELGFVKATSIRVNVGILCYAIMRKGEGGEENEAEGLIESDI
jgi:hypothetical protein